MLWDFSFLVKNYMEKKRWVGGNSTSPSRNGPPSVECSLCYCLGSLGRKTKEFLEGPEDLRVRCGPLSDFMPLFGFLSVGKLSCRPYFVRLDPIFKLTRFFLECFDCFICFCIFLVFIYVNSCFLMKAWLSLKREKERFLVFC